MKTQFGVIGHKGKIGSTLVRRANFVPVNVDLVFPDTMWLRLKKYTPAWENIDVFVNCAGMSSIDECEVHYHKAVDLNVTGLKNLHLQFGSRILNLGSEQIYRGGIIAPKETTSPSPINMYGLTKAAAEGVSNAFDGKTIRLSRTISVRDSDVAEYLNQVELGKPIYVPVYMTRNYITRLQAEKGITYFAHHYDELPHIVNYGNLQRVSYFKLMRELIKALGLDSDLVKMKFLPDRNKTKRPLLSGLNVTLAKSHGFPMFNLSDTVSELKDEYESLRGNPGL